MYSLTRNSTQGFARRVRKNLEFVITQRAQGEDVHEVTQLIISLLGLIVFPWEAGALSNLESLPLSKLEDEGWPTWEIELDEKGDTSSLGKLVWHLRNATSHRRLRFSGDARDLSEVEVILEDAPSKSAPVNWRAKIGGSDLKAFCDQFTRRLEDMVG